MHSATSPAASLLVFSSHLWSLCSRALFDLARAVFPRTYDLTPGIYSDCKTSNELEAHPIATEPGCSTNTIDHWLHFEGIKGEPDWSTGVLTLVLWC